MDSFAIPGLRRRQEEGNEHRLVRNPSHARPRGLTQSRLEIRGQYADGCRARPPGQSECEPVAWQIVQDVVIVAAEALVAPASHEHRPFLVCSAVVDVHRERPHWMKLRRAT